MWMGIGGLEEEDPEPRRGFRTGVDLCFLGVIVQSIRERKRKRTEHNTTQNRKEKKRMHEKCMDI